MGKAYRLLSIYDNSDSLGKWRGGHTGDDVMTESVISSLELHNLFCHCVNEGVTFESMLFTTHGAPGAIALSREIVGREEWLNEFYGEKFETLFPFPFARIYFDGCNVAEGEAGWQFLEATGLTFLRAWGGAVLGWTSLGFGVPSFVPFIGSHTVHPWGDARIVTVGPASDGGLDLKRCIDD
jgi:hypothetical protein